MSPLIIYIAAFVGVAALVGGVALMFRGDADEEVEERLSVLTGKSKGDKRGHASGQELLAASIETGGSFLEKAVNRYLNLSLLIQQADARLTIPKFLAISGLSAVVGGIAASFTGLHVSLVPVLGATFALFPLMWLVFRRKRRLAKFAAQLPEALELVARALRAGHSLAAGLNLVASEMSEPIGKEFGAAFEEQNLGIPMEEALENMTERVPNLDLKFFATAVILQRQTGGDLAEILDKIGHLIRERFQIWGQVQALTGEGRLSGVVLLALPPALFVVVYKMNPDYLMLLFTDELGKKMLVGGVVMQLLGALAIRKIVNIRV